MRTTSYYTETMPVIINELCYQLEARHLMPKRIYVSREHKEMLTELGIFDSQKGKLTFPGPYRIPNLDVLWSVSPRALMVEDAVGLHRAHIYITPS